MRLDKHGNTIGVPVEFFEAGNVKVPWLDPVSLVQWLADSDSLQALSGEIKITEFWRRFASFQPEHPVFSKGLPLHRVIPFLSHGDEGRTKKKKGILIWSFHGVSGSGTRQFRERDIAEQTDRMPLNLDHSLRSRFIHVAVPSRVYSGNKEKDSRWHAIAAKIGQAYNELLTNGFQYAGQQWYAACVGLTGDSVFLAKAGNLIRSFYKVARKNAAKDPVGVCMHCLAGQRAYPMENLGLNPEWRDTEFTAQLQWSTTPAFLESLGDVRPQVLQFAAWCKDVVCEITNFS